MNVAFIAYEIAPDKGGIESVSYSLAKAFPGYVDFHSYCGSSSNCLDDEYIPDVYCGKSRNRVFLHLNLIRKCLSDYKRFRFDFTFTSHYAYSLPCLLLKKFKGVPYGIIVHGLELLDENDNSSIFRKIYFAIKNRIRRAVIRSADIIFANSEFTKELVQKKYGKYNKNIVVIHPPIEYVDKKIRTDDNTRSYKLLSVGRIVERKGFQYVIDALKNLVVDIPELKYYIAGSGPYMTALKEKVENYGLQNNVFFLGRVSEEEKDRLYRECDYFIMPSYIIEGTGDFEGFGIVYIEANMYGKFVIATKSGGIPDAVCEGITGAFVEVQNSESIYLKLKELYRKDFFPDRSKCIEWSKKMDENNIVKQYIDAIEDVLNNNKEDR